MLRQADPFDVALPLLCILGKALDERCCPTACCRIFENWNQLIDKIGIGWCEDDLSPCQFHGQFGRSTGGAPVMDGVAQQR